MVAKFGLFMGALSSPSQEYEGDYMTQNGEYVTIWIKDFNEGDQQVAAIRLDKNQSVKKL